MKHFVKQFLSGVLACGLILLTGQAHAAVLISVGPTGCTGNTAVNDAIAQSFRVNATSRLEGIDVWLHPAMLPVELGLELYDGEGPGGPRLLTSTTILTVGTEAAGYIPGFYAFNFDAESILLQPDRAYTFRLVRRSQHSPGFAQCGPVYDGGMEYWVGEYPQPGNDVSFRLRGTVVTPPPHAPTVLRYGQTYSLRNGHAAWQGGFLDTRSTGCEGNRFCVSTATTPNRDGASGTWKLLSATGKAVGTPVSHGDDVYLLNMYQNGFGGYLDAAYMGCEGNSFCVSTSGSENRDQRSGTWKILSDSGTSGPIMEAQSVHLRNGFANFVGGYLDTKQSGCEGNLLCVSTSSGWNRNNEPTNSWALYRQ
jgi:hypothetical protein